MKHIILLLIIGISLSQTPVNCQTNKPIDAKSGYKDFKIGDMFLKWKNQVSYDREIDGVHFYIYTGSCCRELFGKKISEIKLGFQNGKLIVIAASFEIVNYKLLDDKYLKFYEDDFIAAFGKPDNTTQGVLDKINSLEEWKYSWVGKQTSLELYTYYGPTIEGKMTASFLIFSTDDSYSNRRFKEF